MSGRPTGPRSGLNGGLSGTWHLLDLQADEINIPNHRMDLVFRGEAGQLDGWVVSRVNADELPLVRALSFDGDTLRFQLAAPPERTQAEMPFLVMRRIHGRFEGQWVQDGIRVGPGLKLIHRNPEEI